MTSREIREKYIKFFTERGHKEIPAAPLVLENDPTTLFTSAGMQPLAPYLKGEPHPLGKRLVNSQPSFRSQDIMEVGDNRHTTFFEMLGNWSLGDYFKRDQLAWFYEFLTKKLNLPAEKLYVTVFEGKGSVPKDEESAEIWKNLGVPDERIFYYGADKNWWSMSGAPDSMKPGDIGGPDSEVFYDFGTPHDPRYGKNCHPNCGCGRFLEIGNSVFIQYFKDADGTLKELPQKNVDFGGGLERLAAAVNNDPDMFKTDLFWPIVQKIEELAGKNYEGNEGAMRIIADHVKAAAFIITAGVIPSNKLQGYVLRRLLRRSAVKMHQLEAEISTLSTMAETVFGIYNGLHSIKGENLKNVQDVINEEMQRFSKSLDKGLKEFEKYVTIGEVGKPETRKRVLDPKSIFRLYETFGFPYELSKELGEEKGIQIPSYEEFEVKLREHRELSQTASVRMLKKPARSGMLQ